MLTREDFPIFDHRADLVYLDGAASAQKPNVVIDAIAYYYQKSNANVHRASYRLAVESTSLFENSRQTIAGYFGVKMNEVVFTSGATLGINMLALGLKKFVKTGDNIVISALEHHSNILPWRAIAKEKNCELRIIDSLDGRIDLADTEKKIDSRTKIVSITHASNVLGTIQPIGKIAILAKKHRSIFIVDGAQMPAHRQVDLRGLLGKGLDAYVFSGQKVYGPSGIGVLIISNQLAQKIAPVLFGGEMVETVNDSSERYAGLPQILEAGTPNISGAIGLAKALELLYSDTKNFEYLDQLNVYLKKQLSKIKHITLYSPIDCELPIISFNVKGFEAKKISSLLDDQNIAVRAGYMCAEPLVRTLCENGILRVSLGLWNTQEDVDTLAKRLTHIIIS